MAILIPVKTLQTDLIALQSVAASTVVISSVFDFSGKVEGAVFVRFGRRSPTAAGSGVRIRIESSNHLSANNSWFPIATITTAFATCETEPVSGTVGAGTNVITVVSTTNLTAGDLIFIDNSTIGNSEWGRVKSVISNTSVTIEDNLVSAQTGSTLYDSAEIYPPITVPIFSRRIRAVVDGSRFTQAFAIQISLITVDSFSIS